MAAKLIKLKISVWAVCDESRTYGSKRGKARESLPISTI